ncbi:hypothetical protein [Brevundimonas sp.]|uniref:hypothetical protein n=1 Tax=Brevundimonas sp. TaxID=1871086 RepID=UPI0035B032EB
MVIISTALAIGWWRGGHTERFAVAVLIWDGALTRAASGMPGGHELVAASEFIVAVIFTWLAFRSQRWWTLVAAAGLMLCVLVFILEWTTPGLSRYAAVSARLGLWCLVMLSLVAGVFERWLAGEAPVSEGARWRRRKPA